MWAVGGIDRPVIRTSSDGGRTWRAQRAAGTNGLSEVAFADDRHGWAVGVHNLLLATANGGASWTPQRPRAARDGNLYGVSFVDARHGWVVGSGGLVRVTSDGGRTWTAQRAGTRADLLHVQFTDRLHGWIVGAGAILRTSDGGATWTQAYSGDAKKSEVVANEFLLDARRGWESGSRDDGFSNHGLVSETNDGGRTWKRHVAKNFDDVRFDALAFTDSRHGWVGGYQGELWYTDNGGASWGSRRTPALGHRIYRMAFLGPAHGWAVGQAGTILACTG